MAGNYGNQNTNPRVKANKDRDVNTSGFIIRNDRAGKFLKVDYFNRCVTVQIGIIPAGQILDFNAMRNAPTVSQALVFKQMFQLKDICDEIEADIKATGSFKAAAIAAGANEDCRIGISNGNNLNEKPGIYLTIYKNVDPNTGRTSNIEYFPFAGTTVFREYDHLSGQAHEDINNLSQFHILTKAVSEACGAFTMAQAHTVQEAQKFDKLQSFRAMSAMATSLGVDLSADMKFEKKTGSTGGWNRGNDNSGGYNKPKTGGGQWPSNNRSGGYNNQGGNRGSYNNGNRSSVFEGGQSGGYNSYNRGNTAPKFNNETVEVNLDSTELNKVALGDFQ